MITHVLKGGNHLDQDKIIPYVEPIFRFCCNRLKNRCDAEDLSGEILGWNTQTPYVKLEKVRSKLYYLSATGSKNSGNCFGTDGKKDCEPI